ncbi:exosortase A [Duganella sp. CF517]|uniref:exosortase A n=1 Tax=Duganella sp. CF517 TaxID=1881038 RepID=UPI0008B60A73|nr:exosortase A [Duganella sp. CF517]SEN84962.1 exosortase A [Duganella sp. CF517]
MSAISAPARAGDALAGAGRGVRRASPGARAAGWALLLMLLMLLPLAAYWSTAVSIEQIWARSETFAHGYLIVPISLWLAWQRRQRLRAMTPAPFWPALLPLAGCGMLWLLADLGEVQVIRQYAFVAMFPLTALAVLGWRMARVIAFPLLFLFLAVPVGDSLIEPLMAVTANFTVAALRLSGIPVLHEGNNFMLPSGGWSVVEACSGLRYLIASLTAGVLYAYMTYTRWWKRVLFVAVAALLPILANGLRAYMIVMLGHLSGMTLAVGVDHLLYGWLFFGIVILALFLVGARWRDGLPPALAPVSTPAPRRAPTARIAATAFGVLVALGVWPAYAGYLQRSGGTAPPIGLDSFPAKGPMTTAFTDWQPAWTTPAASLRRYYAQQSGQVGLSLLYYRHQTATSKLITSMNRLTPMVNSPWNLAGGAVRNETVAGRTLAVRESTLHRADGALLVWHWYRIDGRATTSDSVGKLLQIRQRVLGGSDDGAAVMLFAPLGEHPDGARAAMRAFLADNLGAIDATLARVRAQPGATR